MAGYEVLPTERPVIIGNAAGTGLNTAPGQLQYST